MLWRLSQNSGLGRYRTEDCWAVVVFEPHSETIGTSCVQSVLLWWTYIFTTNYRIAGELLTEGFNVLLVGDGLQDAQESLSSTHTSRQVWVTSDRVDSLDPDSLDAAMKPFASIANSVTVVCLCSSPQASQRQLFNASHPYEGYTTVCFLRAILPLWSNARQKAILLAGYPVSFYSDDHDNVASYYGVSSFVKTTSVQPGPSTELLCNRCFRRNYNMNYKV